MNTKALPRQKKTSPLFYAIGTVFTVPIAAILFLFLGVMLLVLWPAIPFLSYFQRREELNKAATNKMDQSG